jgi:NCAIR mutase (PurE)-related protein
MIPSTPRPPAFAAVDLERAERLGAAEVIFGEGKTAAQIVSITRTLRKARQPVLITRLSPEKARAMRKTISGLTYDETSRCGHVGRYPLRKPPFHLAIVSAGTSDQPVAEEAAQTAAFYGITTERINDIGVAGLHRLISRLPDLQKSHAVIVVAGMEGALPSVVAGLIKQPIIAVPTSVGYGANFGGLSALLGMLTSCASGVTVVNIDNGFGAAFAALRLAHLTASLQPSSL